MTIFSDIGRFIIMLKGALARPENNRMYWNEYMDQCAEIGVGSLGIVSLVSLFMGAVSSIQTAYQLLSPLLPKSTIGQVVRNTVILEFAPTLSCMVLAGVVGSKIASELGHLRVNEQIDALEVMGVNSKVHLIMPKILASLTMVPFLVITSMAIGIWGGRLAAIAGGILTGEMFDEGLFRRFSAYDIVFALAKTYVFAFIIASVPSFYGYYAKGGSAEIGIATTKAVIASCILILFSDYLLSSLLL